MKKLFTMALMAAAATTAFAQDALVKEAKKHLTKNEFDQAAEVLRPALNSPETVDKAAAWNLMSEIQFGKYTNIQAVDYENQVKGVAVPYDTAALNNAIEEALEAALECDKYDRQPNEKGKVKLRFRQANQQKMQNTRLLIINAGQHAYKQKDQKKAFKRWALYVDSNKDELFEGVDLKDQYLSEVAYYAALAAYFEKDYPNAEKYAGIAAQDPEKADEANEIMLFSAKENMKTPADSAAYVNKVKELHKAKPEEDRYFNLLMDYYTRANNPAALKAWAEEEVKQNDGNKMAWAIVGEVAMNSSQWDDAVEAYKKAIEIDPEFVQCVFNAGVCLNSKAIALNDQLADKKTGGLTNENAEKVKSVLRNAKDYLERARELDPEREKVNWSYPLYRIYYSLQDKDKMAELEAIDPSLK